MNATKEELKQQLRQSMDALQTLRDEIRVRMHLAGMEAKEKWRDIEPLFLEAEKKAQEVNEASHKALLEIVKRVKEFRASLKEH